MKPDGSQSTKTGLGRAAAVVVMLGGCVVLGSQPVAAAPVATAGSIQAHGRAAATYADDFGAVRQNRVFLYAWPSEEVMSRMKVGDSFKLQAIASSNVDTTGNYNLSTAAVNNLAPFASRFGVLNLEVSDSAGLKPFSFSTKLGLTAQGLVAGFQSIDGATSLGSVEIPYQQMADRSVARTGSTLATTQGMPKGCTSTVSKDNGVRQALVGQRYTNSTAIANTDFQYTVGASSSTGVGISASGAYGSFSSSGNQTVTSSGTIDFPTKNVSTYDRTMFSVKTYRVVCSYPSGQITDIHYEARSTFAGGATSQNVGLPSSFSRCTHYDAGSAFTKQTTAAVDWSNGLNTGPVIGIDLHIKTGYSSEAKVVFKLKTGGSLCGTNDYPGGNAQQIVAKL